MTKPFHESIIEAVKNAKDKAQLEILAMLVKATDLEESHEEIMEAFQAQGTKMNWSDAELDKMLEAKK